MIDLNYFGNKWLKLKREQNILKIALPDEALFIQCNTSNPACK
jgi:hypothetical protein